VRHKAKEGRGTVEPSADGGGSEDGAAAVAREVRVGRREASGVPGLPVRLVTVHVP
jgi:hypothetical protein